MFAKAVVPPFNDASSCKIAEAEPNVIAPDPAESFAPSSNMPESSVVPPLNVFAPVSLASPVPSITRLPAAEPSTIVPPKSDEVEVVGSSVRT